MKGGFILKKSIIILFVLFAVLFAGCSYNAPAGYTLKHHTYEDALAYAKMLDPNATVSEEYTDLTDEWDYKYRQWPAVIMGVECHVASVTRMVWNDGFLAGEFAKIYYAMDTDYDYLIMQQFIRQNHPEWIMSHTTISGMYHINDLVSVEIPTSVNQALTEEELETIWQTVSDINDHYCKYPVHKEAWFSLHAPLECTDPKTHEKYIKINSNIYITDYTAEGKAAFFEKYRARWALLETDIPVRE
jgi:hypothetical protein